MIIFLDLVFQFYFPKDHGSVVKAIYSGSGFLETVSAGLDVGLVLESTSFYAEQGGQVSTLSMSIR